MSEVIDNFIYRGQTVASIWAELERVKGERDALQKQVDDSKKVELVRYEASEKGFEAVMSTPIVGILAMWCEEELNLRDAKNFVEHQIYVGPAREVPYIITIQRGGDGKSPGKLLAEATRERDALAEKLAQYAMAFPVCTEHAPMGGARSGCPVCAMIKRDYALSEIDQAMDPNIDGLSRYDVDGDTAGVVSRVKALAAAVADAEVVIEQADVSWGTPDRKLVGQAALDRFRNRNKETK